MKHFVYPLLLILLVLCSGCGWPGTAHPTLQTMSTQAGLATPHWGVQTKTSGCGMRGQLPDPACTPGDILPNATVQQVCTAGYASAERNVSQSLKRQVYAAYGITQRLPGQYEVDHLVNLSIGGSNDLTNLWPQPATPVPGYKEKNRVEVYLQSQVCSGALSLREAEIEIATNWVAVYNRLPK
ncbi:MAG: HNH endonuclease signature motif containing protein [Ktedonobacteraceae bacterium]